MRLSTKSTHRSKLNRFSPCSPASRSAVAVACLFALGAIIGCQQTPSETTPTTETVTVPGGTATADTGPIVRFTSPTNTLTVRDDQVRDIGFSVDAATDATVALFLDPDNDAANGNELDLAAGLQFPAGVTTSSQDLVAGFFPYGTYFVRAQATDGTKNNVFNAPGIVNIVAGDGAFGTDDGLDTTAGLQLLYDSGKPQAVSRRIPFVDTWHVVDVLDNLSPRIVVPIQFTSDVEIHRIQFYVFGIDEPRDKRVDIFRGTDQTTVGEQIQQLEVTNHDSRRNGWWNTVTPPSPIALPAGSYGFSYHAALEFTEHWAGNAPVGAGFAWMSSVQGAPFAKATTDEFGFVPNFGIRIIGRFMGKSAGGARARLPDRRAEAAEVARSADTEGAFIDDPKFYRYDREKRGAIHVVWRRAASINR